MIDTLTPEAQELKVRNELIGKLENELAEKELDFQNLTYKLVDFDQRYTASIGRLYAELDRLKAEISQRKAEALQTPESLEDARQAAEAAKQSAFEAGGFFENTDSVQDIQVQESQDEPSAELKQMFKKAAMRLHPDRAADDADRTRKTALMAELNTAYAKRDEVAIKLLIEKAASEPDAILGDDFGAQLIRAIRKQSQLSKRMVEVDKQIEDLKEDELFTLMETVIAAEESGSSPLNELAASIKIEIVEKRVELEELAFA